MVSQYLKVGLVLLCKQREDKRSRMQLSGRTLRPRAARLLVSVRNRKRLLPTGWNLGPHRGLEQRLLLAVQHIFVFLEWES